MFMRIEATPDVCHGKPRIKGTRVLVSQVVLAVAAGSTIEEVAEDYEIEPADVIEALEFAGSLVEQEELVAA